MIDSYVRVDGKIICSGTEGEQVEFFESDLEKHLQSAGINSDLSYWHNGEYIQSFRPISIDEFFGEDESFILDTLNTYNKWLEVKRQGEAAVRYGNIVFGAISNLFKR